MTAALLEGFYAQNPNLPQFLDLDVAAYLQAPDSPSASSPQLSIAEAEPVHQMNLTPVVPKPEFRLQATEFVDTWFAKDYYPKFTVTIGSFSGAISVPPELMDFQVAVSVHNKWVDVTSEVVAPATELIRTVRNGVLDISDLIFIDVSLKHGGHFAIHVSPIGLDNVVAGWVSPNVVIQSVKTHCNKKRKSRETPALTSTTYVTPSAPAKLAPHNPSRMDSYVLNDVKSFLMPSMPMDALDYGLSGGFFDPESDMFPSF